ncbi:hypothetical protein KAZ01_02350 [Candidatus Gracilibacteria bacterium]|nr:hypothetical protein [Candidatus Gracilibacteria bacterium]
MENENQNKIFIDEDQNEGPSKEERVLAAICYIPFGFLLPFIMQKDSHFLSLHIKQGGVLFGIYFVITTFIFMLLPGFIVFRFGGIFFLIYVGFIVFGSMKAYNGESYEFSFVTKIINFLKDKFQS